MRFSLRHQLNFSRWAIRAPWLTIGFWLAISVAGLFAFSALKYALFPDVTFPVVVVNASAPLATALDTETQLTNPLEAAIADLEGLGRLRSTTTAGRSLVSVRYKVGRDLTESADAVRAAVDGLETLPAETEIEILPFNLNESVAISYAIVGGNGDLTALADQVESTIIPALEALPGVLRVDLLGTGAPATPTADRSASAPALATLVQRSGEPALGVQVIKEAAANTLEVVSQTEAAIADLRAEFDDTVDIGVATTQADYIREATQATISALVQAIALAVLVIFAFLRNWRATLITALSIPLSLLATFIVMATVGFNLETITLLALALVIGIIVDDAIVEVENIIRHLEAGESPRRAALNASAEIGLTVSASTLTIVAVFVPVAFMGGTVGQFFKPFGLTVSVAVLASLLTARTLVPVLAVYWLRSHHRPGTDRPTPTTVGPEAVLMETPDETWLTLGYERVLHWALHHRRIVVAIAIVSFAIGVALIPLIPQGFIPKLDRGEFNITFTAPLPNIPAAPGAGQSSGTAPPSAEGSTPNPADLPVEDGLSLPENSVNIQVPDLVPDSPTGAAPNADPLASSAQRPNPLALILDNTQAIATELEAVVLANPAVDSVFTIVGSQGQPNQGQIYVKLRPDRDRTTAEVQDQMRQDLPDLTGVRVSVEDIQFVDVGGEKPLQVTLSSDDLVALNQAAQTIRDEVEALPGFVDVGVSGEANTAEDIREIKHLDQARVAYISANLSEDQALGTATQQVITLAESTIPESVRLGVAGDSERILEVLGSFAVTLALAIVCMMVVLFIPFGRLLEPAVVGLSLPLAIVGAMLALLVTQSDFGMVSVIGLLFLLGLLDKNALLLMDYANQLRRAGVDRTEAVLKTGLVRMRPILMTTASTILGMLPIAFGWGAGSELRQPMAVAIIGGLATSTLLSLIVVPVLYTLLEDSWAILATAIAKPIKGK